jgi:hypothetical protein
MPARLVVVLCLAVLCAAARADSPRWTFQASLSGAGTEVRNLVAHDGKLFAANGYWKDTAGPFGTPGAQILVLDRAGGSWRVDHAFDDQLRGLRRRHLTVSALAEVTFRTDARGTALPAPVPLLLASTWDLTGAQSVFVRDDGWREDVLAQDRPAPGFLPQIRSFGFHRDRVTGVDRAFAGASREIYGGAYASGRVAWIAELATQGLAADQFPGLAGRLRISSFAEARGRLFAAIGQQVWVRQDGPAPAWTLFYTNPRPFYSQTGLRGLTAVTDPGAGTVLLAAAEGNRARIVRIDPDTGSETTELDLAAMLDREWGTKVSYVIAAYNDMAKAGDDLLIGLEAFIPPASPRPPGHAVLDVVHGLEAGGWFLVRRPGGRYELRQVTAAVPGIGRNLVAVRSIVASPFVAEPGSCYFAGYDANDTPAHGTGWIARGEPAR